MAVCIKHPHFLSAWDILENTPDKFSVWCKSSIDFEVVCSRSERITVYGSSYVNMRANTSLEAPEISCMATKILHLGTLANEEHPVRMAVSRSWTAYANQLVIGHLDLELGPDAVCNISADEIVFTKESIKYPETVKKIREEASRKRIFIAMDNSSG